MPTPGNSKDRRKNLSHIHMVTGGTGFIGSCIILELLRQTDAEIICLVRPGKEPVESRLKKALKAAAHA